MPSGPPVRLSRYDLVLLAIPLFFLVGAGVAALTTYSISTGVQIGGVLAVLPTAYALFGAPPTERLPRSERARENRSSATRRRSPDNPGAAD